MAESRTIPLQAGLQPRQHVLLRRALAVCWLLGCLLLAAWLVWGSPATTAPLQAQREATTVTAAPTSPQPAGLRRIETIRPGERVLGRNPQRPAVAEPDPATWRQIDLELRKPSGRMLYAALLRGPSWLEENEAQVGGTIWLDMPEMGAVGRARVTAVGPCPPIQPGPGQVVTGTFKHEPDDTVLDVRVEGLAEPIGVTDTHPFWSEDRRTFVPAGKLRAGERVRTAATGVAAVTSIAHRPREAWVYNLEVHGEHVYQVSEIGVLVHNTNSRNPAQDRLLTKGDIKKLQDAGHDVHELKGGKGASKYDLYKDPHGNVYVKPKGGAGPGDPTGINLNDL